MTQMNTVKHIKKTINDNDKHLIKVQLTLLHHYIVFHHYYFHINKSYLNVTFHGTAVVSHQSSTQPATAILK